MYLDLAVKLIISFFGLWMIAFITGRKVLSQLTPLDFMSSLVLSEIVGNTLYDDQAKVSYLLFSLTLWTFITYIFEKITTHFVKFGSAVEGRAALIIDDGKVNKKLLKKYDIEYTQLLSMLRKQNVFSLREVKHAILETDGSLSVLRQPESEPQSDLLTVTVIDNGELLENSMQGKQIDIEQVEKQIREQGYSRIEEIDYAEYGEDGALYIIPK